MCLWISSTSFTFSPRSNIELDPVTLDMDIGYRIQVPGRWNKVASHGDSNPGYRRKRVELTRFMPSDDVFHVGRVRLGRNVTRPGNMTRIIMPSTISQTKGHDARKISVVGKFGAALLSANST